MEELNKSYNQTLNIPKTDFPLVANLNEREPFILERMEIFQTYNKLIEKNKVNNKTFILHDGPSYANLDITLGHALNKVLKDIIIRYKSMNGYYAPFILGWDTHGLPLEKKVQEKYNVKTEDVGVVKFRDMCRDYALECVESQITQFKRLGLLTDFSKRYVTLNPKIEERQIGMFWDMYKSGYIYRGLKPVNYCRECKSAVAEADLEYSEDRVENAYVKFRIIEDVNNTFKGIELEDIYLVIYTDKLWTLIGNQAILAIDEDDYSLVDDGFNKFVIATKYVEKVMEMAGISKYIVIQKLKGKDLENIIYSHPFVDREGKVILKKTDTENALLEETGLINIAPGLGIEDYKEFKSSKIEVILPIDDNLIMTKDAGIFEGYSYYEGAKKIKIFLKETGYILCEKAEKRKLPHCKKCKQPVIERATTQWFVNIEKIKERSLESIKSINFIPNWGEKQLYNMIANREDWCISRQRVWGVPIPVFYCEKCGHELINENLIKRIRSLVQEQGSRAWYEMDTEKILDGHYMCSKCAHNKFKKEIDTMDVWFDSGCTHETILNKTPGLSFPADMYLEGKDQYRGWFQASLLTSIATKNEAPYKNIISHGFVVDGNGKKIVLDEKNLLTTEYIIKKYGADVLRLWTVSGDYTTDVKVSEEILKQVEDVYNKIRTTSRFMLANLSDFVPERDYKMNIYRSNLDRYVLLKLNKLIEKVSKAYEKYAFHEVYILLRDFYISLSSKYLECIKGDLYTLKTDSIIRRGVQSTLYDLLISLTKLISPILSFTSEEIWGYMQFRNIDTAESVVLSYWPKVNIRCLDTELEDLFNKINCIKEEVDKKIVEAKKERIIKSSLDGKVVYYTEKEEEKSFILTNKELLKQMLVVSDFEVLDGKEKIKILKADGEKCARCLKHSRSVGLNREHLNLCKNCVENIK